ncbi:MAG: hypothetical protein GY708_28650 [Actinomycetia bacterium]|nr:hypothetical protein [Actinomycetes bacterium]MCP5031615.1 hypothetical protein [Actinomycetes bacterium]
MAFRFRRFANYRIRALLYAGRQLGPTPHHHTPPKREAPFCLIPDAPFNFDDQGRADYLDDADL